MIEALATGAVTLAGDAGKSTLSRIKQQLDYMFHYQSNIVELGKKQNELKEKMDEAEIIKEKADKKFQEFFPRVRRWQKETQELHQKAQEFLDKNKAAIQSHRCLNGCCRNPWSCYSLGKEAWKMTQEVNNKIGDAPDFGATYDTLPLKLEFTFNFDGIKDFDSRQSLIDEVLTVLKDDEQLSMIGICGTGGVGKTTLAKMLVQRVQNERSFDEIAMITVSQNPNLQKIQDEIIELLGFKIDDRTLPKRAMQLSHWLNYGKKTLLILDDVWEELDFEAIGLPSAPKSKGCKIVLTSRNEYVCRNMGSMRNFLINLLKADEAWDLFKEIAGESIEELDLDDTARKIADECDCLPIAIVTVAKSLQGKPKCIWDNSLEQLRNSNLHGIQGMDKVYSGIQLSYDLLKDKEAQSCFRLCCLYPEDFNVPIEDLVLYGMGLRLFENVASLKQARDKVNSAILKLKTSNLLLDGEKEDCVKMHDLFRDFAINITSKGEDSYVVGCKTVMEKWPETNRYNNCRAISLVCNEINEHPVVLECPDVELLQIVSPHYSARLPVDFFERMKMLKVVSLDVPSLLQSLDVLKELKTLRVKETGLRWKETSKVGGLLGNLTNLEILSVSTNGRFKDFPMEIGQLAKLRLLDFSGTGLTYIPPGVLSRMVELEELYLPRNFVKWGCKVRERTNASLREIDSLHRLTALQIGLLKASVLSDNLVKNLVIFNVYIGSHYSPERASFEDSKALLEVFDVDASDIEASWISAVLIRKSGYLRLMHVKNLKNIMYQIQGSSGFRQTKKMYISDCHELECLIDTASAPESLRNTIFLQLKSLSLHNLSNLEQIWCSPKIEQVAQLSCFGNLVEISIVGCGKLKCMFSVSMARGMRRLQSIDIRSCGEMETIFYDSNKDETTDHSLTGKVTSSSKAQASASRRTSSFKSKPIVRRLSRKGKHPKTVSNKQMEETEKIVFPQLQMLKLVKLPKLRAFCDAIHTIELPLLESLEIYNCSNMKTFSYGSLSHSMLKEIQINKGCYSVMEDLNSIMKEPLKDDVVVKSHEINENQNRS